MKLVVIGGINVDFIMQVTNFPKAGESTLGLNYLVNSGGKGANKAVAAAKLGATVFMVGKVGDDFYGSWSLKNLNASGVNTEYVLRQNHTETGKAIIIIDTEGVNRIIAFPGANREFMLNDIQDPIKKLISQVDAVLLQFEIPQIIVEHCIDIANIYKVPIILNAAPPVYSLSASAWSKIDYLICNENETYELCKAYLEKNQTIRSKIQYLFSLGVNTVIITLGEKGVLIYQGKEFHSIPARKIKAIDTTAAGDAFVAGFAIAINRGLSVKDSVNYGQVIAALTTTRIGTQDSLPSKQEIDEFMGKTV